MSQITVAQARARGIALPSDSAAAQAVIDEQEAWLARRIGQLVGSRTERFYVGPDETRGKLGLARYTDSVTITDGGSALATDQYRLVDRGSSVVKVYEAASRWWTGPYVLVTYTPNDETLVESVLYDLVALAAQPATPYESEQIGSYSYRRGTGTASIAGQRAALISQLLPKHDATLTLRGPRRLASIDPVINRAEPRDIP